MRRSVVLPLLVVVACGGTSSPAAPSGEEAVVRSAYLDAWAVRDEAVHRAHPALLLNRFVDEDPSSLVGNLPAGAPSALQVVSDMVTARIEANLDVRGEVAHNIQSLAVGDDNRSAQVIDHITDGTYLVDRGTGARQTSDAVSTYTEIWFLVKRGEDWKVVYFSSRGSD